MSYAVPVRLAGCIAAMLLALPCAMPAPAQTQTVIRLGVGPGDAFSEGYYAQQQGFFKKAGLNVEIRPFRTGATIMTGVAAKSIDIGISNVPALAQEISRGAPLVLIAGGGLYTTRDAISALCVASGSPLRAPADFVGKTIAVIALRDQSHLGTLAWLDHSQVDISKVHFITLPFNEMAVGIESGLADAALITEPWLSAAVRTGKFRILAKPYDVIAPQFLIGVWFTTSEWYAEHSDIAKRFVKVIYETARWANAHHEQTAKLLSQTSKVDVQTILSMTRTPYPTILDPALVQPPLDMAFKYHAIDHALNASNLIVKSDR
ncbi:MAG TPA: ABC transporter substrate-binding protein [Candidatus Binatia bacterium]|nr:ABC transporter substrate-binding protein [Candidatus Binatia bacterium]